MVLGCCRPQREGCDPHTAHRCWQVALRPAAVAHQCCSCSIRHHAHTPCALRLTDVEPRMRMCGKHTQDLKHSLNKQMLAQREGRCCWQAHSLARAQPHTTTGLCVVCPSQVRQLRGHGGTGARGQAQPQDWQDKTEAGTRVIVIVIIIIRWVMMGWRSVNMSQQ